MSYLRRHPEGIDLVERDDRDPLLQLPILEELLAYFFVLDHDVVQLPACGNFKRGGFWEIRGVQGDQVRD